MSNKMFFFDIDGTLIDCVHGLTSLYDTTKETLDELKQKGHDVFLATGRCPCFIADGVRDYDYSGYVTCNGGYVTYKGEVLFKEVISGEVVSLLDKISRERNLLYFLEGVDHVYVRDIHDHRLVDFCEKWEMKKELLVDDFDVNEIETFIGMISVNCEDDVRYIEEYLSPYFYVQRHMHGLSFDLTIKGVSKAVGILKVCEAMNRSIDDTIAFGDGTNDIEMLSTVGFAVAMDNACQEAKDVSDYITKSVLDDGVSYAVKDLGYIGE